MLDFFLSYLLVYTYLVLFLVTLLTSFVFPLPATALIMAAWAFVSQGYLDLKYVLLFSFLWCILGDISWYVVSFFYWKSILYRLGFKKIIKSSRFKWLKKYFKTNSKKTIFFSRFLFTWLCSSVNILAWLTKIKYKKFILLDVLGEIIYVLLFVYLWYFLWNQWQYIALVLEDILTFLVLIIFILIIIKLRLWSKKDKI